MSNDENIEKSNEEVEEIIRLKDKKHYRKPISKIMNITNFLHLNISNISPKSLIKFRDYSPLSRDFDFPKKFLAVPIFSARNISHNSNQASPKNIKRNYFNSKPQTPIKQNDAVNKYTNLKSNNSKMKIKFSPRSPNKKNMEQINKNQTTSNLNKKNQKIKFTKKNVINSQQINVKNKNFNNFDEELTERSKKNNINKGSKDFFKIDKDKENEILNKNMNDNLNNNYNYSNEMKKKKNLMRVNDNADLIYHSEEINNNKNKIIDINVNDNYKKVQEKLKEKEEQVEKNCNMFLNLNSKSNGITFKPKTSKIDKNGNKIVFRKKNIHKINKVNNTDNNNNNINNNITNNVQNNINNKNKNINNNIIENNDKQKINKIKNTNDISIKNERIKKLTSIFQKLTKKILFNYLMEWLSINIVDDILNSIQSKKIVDYVLISSQSKLLVDDLMIKGKTQVIVDDLIYTSKSEIIVDDAINTGHSNIIVDQIFDVSKNKFIINNIKENVAEIHNKNIANNQNSKFRNQLNILNKFNNNNLIAKPINIDIINSEFILKSPQTFIEPPNNGDIISKSQRDTLFTINSNENDEINNFLTIPDLQNIKQNFYLEKCSDFSF